ncbi:MAG: hypothetical protein R3Y51_08230, partial [Rikenellaceae bacterium]
MHATAKIIYESLEINDNRSIDYVIEFSTRKSLTISISKKDKKLIVKSPLGLSLTYIKNFVVTKRSWIE